MSRLNAPAFARPTTSPTGEYEDRCYAQDGLTVREYFTAAALTGILAAEPKLSPTRAASRALSTAVAVIAEMDRRDREERRREAEEWQKARAHFERLKKGVRVRVIATGALDTIEWVDGDEGHIALASSDTTYEVSELEIVEEQVA